jgi:hypothetical protein
LREKKKKEEALTFYHVVGCLLSPQACFPGLWGSVGVWERSGERQAVVMPMRRKIELHSCSDVAPSQRIPLETRKDTGQTLPWHL